MTYFTKSAGDSLRASQANALLKQGIPPFADATARDAAITAPADGEHAYLTGSDTLMEYQTSAWVIINEPKQTWTPTISQPGSITKTVNWGYSQRQGGMYRATCKLSITGSGTATNPIIVTTPFTHVEAFGSFVFYDTSNSFYRSGNVLPYSTTEYSFVIDSGADLYGIAGTDGMTNGDVLWLSVMGSY
jgi:hypothetical protein